ncbi:hypothetical protein F4824DRAFT_503921 [Ustulina deusta]|nr:hypothetical protein F4824DRAFT_503921 [Ustulina deusta]
MGLLARLTPLIKRHTGQALADEVADTLSYFGTEDRIPQTWTLGKLHNIGVFIRSSSQIQEEFFRAQISIDPENTPLAWVHNVCTRWQSDEAMAARALEKRQAINRMLLQVIEEN